MSVKTAKSPLTIDFNDIAYIKKDWPTDAAIIVGVDGSRTFAEQDWSALKDVFDEALVSVYVDNVECTDSYQRGADNGVALLLPLSRVVKASEGGGFMCDAYWYVETKDFTFYPHRADAYASYPDMPKKLDKFFQPKTN
ncbi:MAG: hypothetical protein NZ828_09030 [Alphaproteobacteria bacterium]|nr:hypothetical protein [Alphaproteobacteria bacterium]